MIQAAVAGAAHFVFVFFKAAQQRNVAFMHYRWVVPISFFMSAMEVFVLSLVAMKAVTTDNILEMWPYVLTLGLGGGLGAILAMYIHHKYIGAKKNGAT